MEARQEEEYTTIATFDVARLCQRKKYKGPNQFERTVATTIEIVQWSYGFQPFGVMAFADADGDTKQCVLNALISRETSEVVQHHQKKEFLCIRVTDHRPRRSNETRDFRIIFHSGKDAGNFVEQFKQAKAAPTFSLDTFNVDLVLNILSFLTVDELNENIVILNTRFRGIRNQAPLDQTRTVQISNSVNFFVMNAWAFKIALKKTRNMFTEYVRRNPDQGETHFTHLKIRGGALKDDVVIEPFPNFTSLTIDSYCCGKVLAALFPNVSKLTLCGWTYLHSIADFCRYFPMLTRLELKHSDLTDENVALLQKDRPEITFVRD